MWPSMIKDKLAALILIKGPMKSVCALNYNQPSEQCLNVFQASNSILVVRS